jgi:molecular chaperone IbpA
MSTIDLTPLYRTLVGFDRLATMIDSAARLDGPQGYPPYNIEQTGEDGFRIELAVAGFSDADIDLELKENVLTVTGARKAESEQGRKFLHRGIAERNFVRRFQLADHVIVTEARLENGMLQVELVRRLPETMKPRKIALSAARPAADAVTAPAPYVNGHTREAGLIDAQPAA